MSFIACVIQELGLGNQAGSLCLCNPHPCDYWPSEYLDTAQKTRSACPNWLTLFISYPGLLSKGTNE